MHAAISSTAIPGTTFYVRPSWMGDLNGYATFAAVDVATGISLDEDDDLTTLMQRMAERHPHLALVENSVTLGALRNVAPEGRL
ncbi:MAG: hypothetical protein M3Y58_12325 [Chloroflexota bacterium]|nr:hypothetical protein [Chloroflexota bacterium]